MNILIVDDHPSNLRLLRAVLEAEGMVVRDAANGVEAMTAMAAETHTDAIVSDILMPQMDGYQLCMEVRASPRLRRVPFIAYSSTYTSASDEKLMLDMGADRFLRKPASAQVLAATVREVVVTSRSRPPTAVWSRPERDILKEYCARLVAKLENRNSRLIGKIERLERVEEELRTAHAQLGRLLEHSPAVIYGLRWQDEKIIPHTVSENITRLLGFDVAETMSHEWWLRQLHPDDSAGALASIGETLARGTSRNEYRLRHKDGTVRWVDDQRRLVRDAEGNPAEFIGVWTDITDRKRTEAELHSSEERFRLITEAIDEVFWVSTASPREITYVSPAYETVWGRSRLSLSESPNSFHEAIHPEDLPRVLAGLEASKTLRPFGHEYRIIRPSGAACWIWDRGFPVRDARGQVTHYVGIAQNITESKRTEIELRQARDRFQSLFQNAIEGIYRSTADGRFLTVNPAMARILGFDSPEELIQQRTDIEQQHYADPARRDDFKRLAEEQGIVFGFSYQARRKDGSMVWVKENAHVIRDPSGRVLGYEGSLGDITESKLAELRLKLEYDVTAILAEGGSLTQTYGKILAVLGGGLKWNFGEMWLVDRAASELRCVETWHAPSPELNNFADARRKTTLRRGTGLPGRIWASGVPDWISDLASGAADGEFSTLAQRSGLRGWIGFPIRLRNDILGVVGFFTVRAPQHDDKKLAMLRTIGTQLGQFIERQRLAEQFRQAQKMEALGMLAGGIAHDFNNILGVITGYAELAREEVERAGDADKYLDGVLTGTRRATELVRQIFKFSRLREQERQPIEPKQIVNETLELLRAAVPATIEFNLSIADDAPVILADATQIHQVLMNLGTNAAHAMSERGGRLTVRLENCIVDADLAATHPDLRSGRYARLTVSDNGHGMEAKILERIFEPFFTTKAPGSGTGLGLAVVHGIVKAHEGAIVVSSRPGESTTFQVYFPAHPLDAEEEPTADSEPPHEMKGERILFVDDEAPIADVSRRILTKIGYLTDACTDSKRALEMVCADPTAYMLVIADQNMPGMTGSELATRLHALNPDLPIILTTGCTAGLQADQLSEIGIRKLLAKPLTVQALSDAIEEVLAATEISP